MTRRAKLSLLNLEERVVPSANRLFALSQEIGRQVSVYLANGSSSTSTHAGFLLTSFDAYAAPFTGGVRIAIGDVTGDGLEDLVTAPGGGGGPHIRVFDGASLLNGNVVVVREFFAFDANFFGGDYVAIGQVDMTTPGQEIIVGAGAGGGAHVRVFGLTGSGVRVTNEFFAYAGGFRGGVRVAAGDTNNDGRAEIITGAGPTGGPHVRVFNMVSSAGLVADEFFAYDANFHGGVYVAAGELNGDSRADIVTGAGEGGGAHVKLYQNQNPTLRYVPTAQFFAGDSPHANGARVGIGNLENFNGKQSLYVGSGTGRPLNNNALPPEPRLLAFDLVFGPSQPTVVNPIVPSVWQFARRDFHFFDTFSTTRAGGLNLST